MLAILEANAARIQAQKTVDEIEVGKVDFTKIQYDALYELVLLASGSEELANSYRVASIKSQTWKRP